MSDSAPQEKQTESDAAGLYSTLKSEVDKILIGNETVVEGLTIALLTRGHVLLEGVPGVAKTTIANAFSRAIGLNYTRMQMTPDVLPADITGTHIYREATGEFELRKGPIFANVAVADEINRATPKTQSALLEAMQERQVTIEGETLSLPDPFLVIATQNPIEMDGTFELAEAQRDRFALKYKVGLPNRNDESTLFDRFNSTPELDSKIVEAVVDTNTILAVRKQINEIYISEPVREYILDIVHATRSDPGLEYGGSPRATLTFLNTSKARAAIHGRNYVLPDDIKALVEPVLIHRLIRNTDSRLNDRSTTEIIDEIVDSVAAPGSEASFKPPVREQ
jgi:MoxR-like ATPase